MKKLTGIIVLLALAGITWGQTFTDLDKPQYHGFQELGEGIDANFALIEEGGIDGNFDELTINNVMTAVSTNDATTNTIVDADATINPAALTPGGAASAINGGAIININAANLVGDVATAAMTNALSGMAGTNIEWSGTAFNLDPAAVASDDLADTSLQPADTNGWVVTDTTYTAGTNLDLNGTQFDLDAAAQASDDLADTSLQPADTNGWIVTDTTYTAGTNLDLNGTTFDLSGNIAIARMTNGLTTPGPIGGTTPAAGAFTTIVATGLVEWNPAQVSVTNLQVLTVAASAYVITGIGSTNEATNTITLAAPAAGGKIVTFMGAFGMTNLITFPSSGATRVPSGLLLDEDDTCTFMSLDNSTWLCTGFIDNQ